jgi:hypothetical protein
MDNPITKIEEVTPEKVAYVEEQVQKNLDFHMESKKLLSDEGKLTLNWLFALTITPAGYVLSKAEDVPWWIAVPALLCSIASGMSAVYLFRNALIPQNVFPAGNEPKNLINDNAFEGDLMWLRLAEICNLQERIDVLIEQNERAANANVTARWAIVLITIASFYLLILLYLINVGLGH